MNQRKPFVSSQKSKEFKYMEFYTDPKDDAISVHQIL